MVGVGSPSSASMSLFQNSNYTEPYPAGPVTLPVGSALYVGVSVGETDPRFVVVLDDCYATHSSSSDDLMRHFLVQNKYVSFFSLSKQEMKEVWVGAGSGVYGNYDVKSANH